MYWIIGGLGVFLTLAPYLFGYVSHENAFMASFVLGLLVVMVSLFEGFSKGRENWEYGVATIVGIVAIISPFFLGFISHTTATGTIVIIGSFIAVMAASKLWKGVERHW